MPDLILESLTQFGAAGLIGLLWLLERRQGSKRDRQLDEAHRVIVLREREIEAMIDVVRANTRAITRLEMNQRRLGEVLDRLDQRVRPSARSA